MMSFIEICGWRSLRIDLEDDDLDEPSFACPIAQLSRSTVTQHGVGVSLTSKGMLQNSYLCFRCNPVPTFETMADGNVSIGCNP